LADKLPEVQNPNLSRTPNPTLPGAPHKHPADKIFAIYSKVAEVR
jgi:hypothetical protein